MTISATRFSVARVTIEMTTGFRSSAFRERGGADMAFIADCNGLPTLPGTSIAGVLRHAWADCIGHEENAWFGFTRRSSGSASLVEVSGGLVHNAHNKPVAFLGASVDDDPVLAALVQGSVRDHVRLNHLGVADHKGKYDELIVPAGARFTFELRVNAPATTETSLMGHCEVMDKLLSLLASPITRLGGATRRGLGGFKVHQVLRRDFDLSQSTDLQAWGQLPVDLSVAVPKGILSTSSVAAWLDTGVESATLSLIPDDFWSIGGGQALPAFKGHRVTGDERGKKEGDDSVSLSQSVPVHEPAIEWDGSRGRVTGDSDSPHHFVPGSAVKGALRHRIEFHARRRLGIWLGTEQARSTELVRYENPPGEFTHAALALGGSIKSSKDKAGASSFAGAFGVDDQHQNVGNTSTMKTMMHVAIDRFTQGPMDGFLFSETAFFKGPELELNVFVNTRQLERNAEELVGKDGARAVVEIARAALDDALDDVCEGRLAIGARSARGLGYMTGKVVWKRQARRTETEQGSRSEAS